MTRFSLPRASAALLVCLTSVALVGCGDNETSEEPDDRAHNDHGGSEAENRALVETEEFQEAAARYKTCIENAGFYSDDDGAVVLKDGSRHQRGSESDKAVALRYAFAEYLSESGRCAEESGIAALRRASGLDVPPDPESVREFNERLIQVVACLQALGWTFRDLITIPGGELFTEPILQPGQQDAYDVDEAQCLQEANQ